MVRKPKLKTGIPSTTLQPNQPLQQSPPTRNTFTSTEVTPLSTMKNQHQKEKAKKKPNQVNHK